MGPSFEPQTAAVWCSCSLWRSSLPFICESDRKIHLGISVTGGGTAVLKERNTSTGPAADRKTLDAKVRREQLTSCLKEPAAASSFAEAFCTWWPQSHYCPGLRVSLADQVFRPHVCLLLLSSSLCLGGAHLWRPPLAHTPGVIRCHGSAWLPEPLFKMAAQPSSSLDRWVTPISWTCSVPWILWRGVAWRGVEWNVSVSAWKGVRSEAWRESGVCFPSVLFWILITPFHMLLRHKLWCNVTGPIRGVNPEDDSIEFLTRMWSFICHMSLVSIINYIKLEIHYLMF